MNITLHIIINPADHALPQQKAAGRYRRGDILDVYPAEKYATLQGDGNFKLNSPPGHDRFAFIHVRGVPNTLSIDNIRRRLSGCIEATMLDDTQIIRRRKFHIPPHIIPAAARAKLLAEREITVTWTQAKNLIRKKVVVDVLDPNADDITTEFQEAEI